MVYDVQNRRRTVTDRSLVPTKIYNYRNAIFKHSITTNPKIWTLTSVGDWSNWKNFSTTAETRTHVATAVVYIHAGQQTVCDYTRGTNANTTPAFRYVWGDYIDEPILRQTGSSTLLYYHHNQQYSTVAITSASGLVVTRFGYTAYGDQTIMSHTGASQTYATYSIRHTYTGREWDDSLKALYFRARWYDATLGRFVNRDPIGYVDGLSMYGGYFVQDLNPIGTTVVRASGREQFSAGMDCDDGAVAGIRSNFALEPATMRAGWIVQKVTVEADCGICDGNCMPCNFTESKTITYFEVWRKLRSPRPTIEHGLQTSSSGWNDEWSLSSNGKNKCITLRISSEIRFYSDRNLTHDSQNGREGYKAEDNPRNWKHPVNEELCIDLRHGSGTLNGWYQPKGREPDFWNDATYLRNRKTTTMSATIESICCDFHRQVNVTDHGVAGP